MEGLGPLLIAVLAVAGVVLARWLRRAGAESSRFDGTPSLVASAYREDGKAPDTAATEDLVARMRNRPLEEVGVGRALPRAARTTGICPRCGRTLDRGRRRCAGCGAWLVDGIPARRAGAFLVRGAAIGVLIGLFGGLFLASLGDRDDASGVTGATRSADESVGPAPAGVHAALDGMLAVWSRLVAARDGLASALADPAADAASLAGQLRAVDAEAAEGVALTAALDRWPGSEELAEDLRSFLVAVREAAGPGLRGDAAAARAAGSAVIESLTRLEALNAQTVDAAREIGLLPPASAPAASPVPSISAPAARSVSPASSPSGG